MYTTTLPITLVLAGALTLINIWLSFRVGAARRAHGISVGDGGNDQVLRRMRAHANFAENVPLVLILVGLIEFAASPSVYLWVMAALFVVARIAHGIGMDGWAPGRPIGAGLTAVLQLLLALWAISIPATGAYSPAVQDVDPVRRER
ncbi:MAPEG family protein [Sphingomonas lenta]|uniref:GST-like protein n=1 Tax=Sphingomonas lenta TaxID=1141887 RepID=A0A2A2SG75_9SPHN|nr:MAPEG family protein [Sphingomonas lenta]PAX08304.1 GST-like protein [Sphingomonas lenta]